MGIIPTKEKMKDTNIADSDGTHIYIGRKPDAIKLGYDWKEKVEIHWKKYQIKETDMRIKTATFTSPNYFDISTGVYCVLIISKYHENFGGEIIKVEYNKDDGLYEYQCQDFSRDYQSKFELIKNNVKLYYVIRSLLTRGEVDYTGSLKSSDKKYHKRALSGLKAPYKYAQGADINGSTISFNPMTQTRNLIIRDKSQIEAIRDLVYSTGAYIDVYFDIYGVCHIAPYTKKDFYERGLRLTSPEFASVKYNADLTNIITGVQVKSTDKKKLGNRWNSENVVNLDLASFFGYNVTSVDNPNQAENTGSTVKTSSAKSSKSDKTSSNPYGTKKKVIWLNIDSIDNYSSDMNKMTTMKNYLKKAGWKVHIAGVGASAHYAKRSKCKKGIWFCLYGGACAGTLKEHCTSDWFLNPLKKNKSRVVVGFFPPTSSIMKGGKYYKFLGPAHDWEGSMSYARISYPAKFLSKKGVPFMYAKTPKKMVAKFLAGGDNYATSGSNYKAHGSWRKHNVKWI